MSRYFVLGIRLVLVLFFLIGMPILALPPVANWCEGQLYAPKQKRRVIAARPRPAQPGEVITVGERTELPWVDQVDFLQPVPPESPDSTSTAPDLSALTATVQALGATYYKLEQLPDATRGFRFVAEFSSDGAVPQRAHYSSTAPTAAGAIQSVIDQIQAGR